MPSPLEDLQASLRDPDQRYRLTEAFAISVLLDNCIVAPTYKVSDAWISPLRLTPHGEAVATAVGAANRRLKPNDLRLAVWLAFSSSEGLLVDAATDVDALRRIVHADVLAGRVLYPWIFGRELHDVAAELYPGRTMLDNQRTLQLLKRLPVGVFQRGRTCVGPFGFLRAPSARDFSPSHSAPGYLCSDLSCGEVHPLHLETGDAGVTRAGGIVQEYLQKHHGTDSGIARPLGDAQVEDYRLYENQAASDLFELIADALTDEELAGLADGLLRRVFKDSGRSKELSLSIGRVIGNPTDFVASLNRPEIMQLLLLHEDREVVAALDDAVTSGVVRIAEYETRTARLHRWGLASGVRAELGRAGVRFASPASASGLVAERLFGLLHHLYFSSGALEPADLAYALGASEDRNEQDLLGIAVRQLSPETVLRELVLSGRKQALAAAEYLKVEDAGALNRDELLERLLWKLGTLQPTSFSDLDRVARHEQELEVGNEEGQSEDRLRGHITNVFNAIEDALQRALTFCTWALTVDHVMAKRPFTYEPEMPGDLLAYLDSMAPTDEAALTLKRDGKNTLAPLAAGFARLAKALGAEDEARRRRPPDQDPQEARLSSKPYAFPSALPYFNLAVEARENTREALRAVAAHMQDETVLKVRNASIHGNNVFPSKREIAVAVERIATFRAGLASTGLYPTVYALQSITRDSLGRHEFRYTFDGHEVLLHQPQWAVAPRLPTAAAFVVILAVAKTPASGPLRFRIQPTHGRDDYWEGYPRRWETAARQFDTIERESGSNYDDLTG